MAIKCPYCGTENPDNAYYCGVCARQLRLPPTSYTEVPVPLGASYAPYAPSRSGMSVGTPPFRIATIAIALAVILRMAELVFRVLYVERYLLGVGDWSPLESTYRGMIYTSEAATAATFVGLFFLFSVFVRSRVSLDSVRRVVDRRALVLNWMLILAAVVSLISLTFAILSNGPGYNSLVSIPLSLNMRVSWYAPTLVWLLGTSALMVILFEAKKVAGRPLGP